MTRRQFLALLVPLLVVIAAFVVVWALERSGVQGAPAWDADFARYVRDRMGQDYVGGVGDERRQEEAFFGALDEYVRRFDGYAAITAPWEVEDARVESSGRYTSGLPAPNVRAATFRTGASFARRSSVIAARGCLNPPRSARARSCTRPGAIRSRRGGRRWSRDRPGCA